MPIEMPVGMDDVQETQPLPEGQHHLRCNKVEEGTAKDQVTPQAILTFVKDEDPNAAPIKVWLTWPKPDDSPEGSSFKRLQIARAQAMVGKLGTDPFDGDAFLDKEWDLNVTQRTLDNGTNVNDLYLPKLAVDAA